MANANKSDLRVLQLISTPMNFNGQTLFPLRIAKSMQRVKSDFLSYALMDERVRSEAEAAGGCVYIAPHRLKHPLAYIRYVSGLVRKEGYSVVHCHGNSCTLAIDLLAARLGGARVRIAHSHNSYCKFTLLHRLLRLPFNHLYTHAMACGEEAGRWLFGSRPFTVIRNAIDARAFAYDADERDSLRREFDCAGKTVLGCVGSFTDLKNHAFLLPAFAKVLRHKPDCLLVMVGEGPLREAVHQQARALGIDGSVRFLGRRTDVPRLLQMMDLMTLPSLFEGFPTVALEWQCAGLPALLSDTITRDCALTDGVKFLPLQADAWADAILAAAPADRAKTSPAGIDAVTRAGYDLSHTAAELERSYIRASQR